MIEDALRVTFAAKAESAPALVGLADVAIRRAGRARRRQFVAVGLAGFVIVIMASFAAFQVAIDRDGGAPPVTAGGPLLGAPEPLPPSAVPSAAPRQIEVVEGGEIYTSSRERLLLPQNNPGPITSAYRARDGYLVVKAQPTGDKQQLLLLDEARNQKVLLDGATNIAVSASGDQVAWASNNTVSVADRRDNPQLGKRTTVQTALATVPVAFVGADIVLGREEGGGFNVWYPANSAYTESWDTSVVRIFGARPDGKSLYAQLSDPAGKPMCLAQLVPDRPFRVLDKVCGLPMAAGTGGGVSPDGRWLAYPVAGQKRIAMLDLADVFGANAKSPRFWDGISAAARTVWLNATTFVVDNGTNFVGLNPAQQNKVETLEGTSTNKVLIEPLRQ